MDDLLPAGDLLRVRLFEVPGSASLFPVGPLGGYCDLFWTPVLGPTAMLTARRLSLLLAAAHMAAPSDQLSSASVPCERSGVVEVSLREFAACAGVSVDVLRRGCARLVRFRVAAVDDAGVLLLRCEWPPVPAHLWGRWPDPLARSHAWWVDVPVDGRAAHV
jgi:hypothetical protein